MGSHLRVEPASAREARFGTGAGYTAPGGYPSGGGYRGRSCKVFLQHIPADVDWQELEADVLSHFGTVEHVDQRGSATNVSAVVTYAQPEEAADAVAGGMDYRGSRLKVAHYAPRGPDRGYGNAGDYNSRSYPYNSGYTSNRGGGDYQNYRSSFDHRPGYGSSGGYTRAAAGASPYEQQYDGASAYNNRGQARYGGGPLQRSGHDAMQPDMPLRMAVDAKYVGAIIGMGGKTIREITRDSKARCVVDVNRGVRDHTGVVEKLINIYGQPESCSRACLRILEVVLCETAKEPTDKALEPELRLKVHNNMVGRLIGKQGATIKKIMDETSCSIFVSNVAELNPMSMERTVTLRSKGNLEHLSQAEQRVSAKLRQCFEFDMQHESPMYHGMPQYPGMRPMEGPFGYGPMMPSSYPPRPMHLGPMRTESVHVLIPGSMVGPIIGAGGSAIRNAMRQTGAHIRIETDANAKARVDSGNGDDSMIQAERRVAITAPEMQQNKAQHWIFHRVADQCYQFFEDLRLTVEVTVPPQLIGRIIGKAGKNVRELQRMTGALVKIPEGSSDAEEETTVAIVGNFPACLAVQNRFRQLLRQYHEEQVSPRSMKHEEE